jgi:hypothetical protein
MLKLIKLEFTQKVLREPPGNRLLSLILPIFVLANQSFMVFVLVRFYQKNHSGLKSWLFGSCVIFLVDLIMRFIFTRVNYLPLVQLLHMGITKKLLARYILFRSLLEWINITSIVLLFVYYFNWTMFDPLLVWSVGFLHLGALLVGHYSFVWFKGMQDNHQLFRWFFLILPSGILYASHLSLKAIWSDHWGSQFFWFNMFLMWFFLRVIILKFYQYIRRYLLFEKKS